MKLSILASLTAALLAPALADPPENWFIETYPSGSACKGDNIEIMSGNDTVVCDFFSDVSEHTVHARGIEQFGFQVVFYTDPSCTEAVGTLDTDSCYVTPESAPVNAFTVQKK